MESAEGSHMDSADGDTISRRLSEKLHNGEIADLFKMVLVKAAVRFLLDVMIKMMH